MSSVWHRIASEIPHAESVLKGVIHVTPLDKSRTLSRMTGGEVYLKLENLQKTGSFKVRGAYYKLFKLSEEERRKGVVAASSGNHAQGVAYSASMLGIRSTIVMPKTTPPAKISAVRSYGAEVVLHGRVYDEAYSEALRICGKTGSIFVHPFNDYDVIVGNGTVGYEIFNSLPDVDVVIVPIGGGGLISGVASIIKTLSEKAKVVGVEPEAAPKCKLSLAEGRIIEVAARPSLADGLVAKKLGEIAFEVVPRLVDDVVTVSEDEIAMAMVLLMERAKIVAEGAGAASVAALISGKVKIEGKKAVALISGGNADLTTLYKVVIRGLAKIGRMATIKCIMPDVPGALRSALDIVATEGGNVVDIVHNRVDPKIEPGMAEVWLIIEAPEESAINRIKEGIKSVGYELVE